MAKCRYHPNIQLNETTTYDPKTFENIGQCFVCDDTNTRHVLFEKYPYRKVVNPITGVINLRYDANLVEQDYYLVIRI